MNDFKNMVAAGFLEARNHFGVSFTVSGVTGTFKGVQRSTDELLPVAIGGMMQDYAGGLEYLSSEVTITNGGKVTIGSTTYRVEHASSSPDDPVRLVYLIGLQK